MAVCSLTETLDFRGSGERQFDRCLRGARARQLATATTLTGVWCIKVGSGQRRGKYEGASGAEKLASSASACGSRRDSTELGHPLAGSPPLFVAGDLIIWLTPG